MQVRHADINSFILGLDTVNSDRESAEGCGNAVTGRKSDNQKPKFLVSDSDS